MASPSDFERILVKDDRIGSITDKVKYAVLKGGQSVTSQTFNAISATTSAHVFNIAVPSLETIVSREVLWTCNFTLRIECPTKNATPSFANMFLVNYGVTDALAAFPLHQMIQTLTATINNNSVSMNIQDVLPALLRLADPDELAIYDSTTPTTLDYLASYRDGIDLLEYQILSTGVAGASMRPAVYYVGPNSHPTDPINGGTATTGIQFYGTATQKFVNYPNNVLAFDKLRSCTSKERAPRGSFIIKRISSSPTYTANLTAPNSTIPDVDTTTVYIDVECTEPLLMSPFIFGDVENKQGFYGINTMNFQFNMASNANRVWRSVKFQNAAGGAIVKNAYVHSVSSSALTFCFLTGHPTDALPSRNVISIYEMPIYRTPGQENLEARKLTIDNGGLFTKAPTYEIKTNTIQLNMIPDKLIIYCKKTSSNQYTCDSDSFLSITNVNITFNNTAGLCSNMTQAQLYKASVQAGIHMSWAEFSGLTTSVSNAYYSDAISESRPGFSGVGSYAPFTVKANYTDANKATPGIQYIPTVGSVVALNFGEHIALIEDYYAPGSIGSFSLQVTLKVQNNQSELWNSGTWETIIIPFNSGIMAIERGTSSIFSALLTKADVLDATENQMHYSHGTVKRMVGGSMLSNLKSALGWISSKLPMVKQMLSHVNHPGAKIAHDVLGAVGYGRSGGGTSGGSKSLENRLLN